MHQWEFSLADSNRKPKLTMTHTPKVTSIPQVKIPEAGCLGLIWWPHDHEEPRLLLSCYSAILNRWFPPNILRELLKLTLCHLCSCEWDMEGGEGWLCNDMSHVAVLFLSHWPELGHMATPSCKGGWEMKYSFWASMYLDNFLFLRQKEMVPGR